MLYGMYEAYITKVVWTSFRPEGPMFRAGGIALFETLMLVLFIHALLAFVIPLFFTELLLTKSNEVFMGFPLWVRNSIRGHPMVWATALMAMFGLMQFVNSSSPLSSLLSGAGNGVVIGLVVLWWRRSNGTKYGLRELLPEAKGLKIFGVVLVVWYLFWGFAIKRESIPAILHGQLTVWIIYAVLLVIFYRCLLRSRREPPPADEPAPAFTWRGFFYSVIVATAVTVAARMWLYPFLNYQMLIFFAFYTITGLVLLGGTVRYAAK
jgi:hypothetical protein